MRLPLVPAAGRLAISDMLEGRYAEVEVVKAKAMWVEDVGKSVTESVK